MLEVNNLSKNYGKRCIFSGFSYKFPETGFVALIGPSGCGKSTFLNLLSGVDNDYDGTIKFDDVNLKNITRNNLQNFRIQNIGYVFQNFSLLNLDTAFNNVYFPLDTISKDNTRIKKQRVLDSLRLVKMADKMKQCVNKLSGGEKQRVAIARAIINEPKLVLCDEPTGALDEKNGKIVFDLLKEISKTTLVIVATHDVESISKIADKIIELKNNKLVIKDNINLINSDQSLLVKFNQIKIKPRISLKFKIRYAFQKMKAKKFRSLITNFLLSLSLTGVGLSLILSNSVSQKVEDAFETILNGNQVVISQKNENENSFSNSYSASYKNVAKIQEKYSYLLDGIGVNYMVNFEDFFKDNNEFYVEGKSKKLLVDSLSARSINDFKWIASNEGKIYYPFDYDYLDDDQIILGLTYEDMNNLCFGLQIQRNYTSLGHYIYENGLFLYLNVKNDYWQYDDEQILNVVAVCESSTTCIMHTDLLWNEFMFEEMMRFPSDDDETHEYPWEMYKIYYLQTKEDPSVFIDSTLKDPELDMFVFERSNFNYNPTYCKPFSSCDVNKVYVYSADKHQLLCSEIYDFIEKGKCDFYYTSDFGYASYSSNLISGFSKNLFVSNNKESIDKAIDADSQITDSTNITLNLPEDAVQGNYMLSLSGGLRFSTDMSKLIYGREPTNLNEIVVSKGLAEKFDKNTFLLGKSLEIAGEIEEYYDTNEHLNKVYNTAKVIVVGVVDENENYIYHHGSWTISFFRDKLGVSSFLLIPRSAVIEFHSKKDSEDGYNKLKSLIKNYKVTSPIENLKSNIDVTLDYANTILKVFSALSLIISILFLGTVVMLNILESKGDVRLFNLLGIRKNNINSIFIVQSVVQGLISFLVSTFELIFVDLFLSFAINKSLGIPFKFSLNGTPILIILIISLIVPFLITKLMLLLINRKKHSIKC